MKAQREGETNLTYYGAEAIVAIGVLSVIGYYIYQSKTPGDKPKGYPVYQPKKLQFTDPRKLQTNLIWIRL